MNARELIAKQIACMVEAIGLDEVFNVLVEVQGARLDLATTPVRPTPPAEVAQTPPASGAAPHANGNGKGTGGRGVYQGLLAYFDQYPLDNMLTKDHCYRWMRNEYGNTNPSGTFSYALKEKAIVEPEEGKFKLTAKGRKRARDTRQVASPRQIGK